MVPFESYEAGSGKWSGHLGELLLLVQSTRQRARRWKTGFLRRPRGFAIPSLEAQRPRDTMVSLEPADVALSLGSFVPRV